MKIIIPKGSGFCPGVLSAEKKLLDLRKNYSGIIYISGMFIHNKEYEKFLKDKNILNVSDYKMIEDGSIFVISTHGIDKNIEETLREKLKVYDFTCPKVKNVQKIIWQNKDYLTIITGKDDHPEIIGLKSYCKNNIVISKIEKLYSESFINNIKDKKILLISQTTSESDLFDRAKCYFDELYKKNIIKEFKSYNTICPSIENREKNAIEILKKNNIKTIVIGDYLSSNSQRLFSKLKQINQNTFFIQNKEELQIILNDIKYDAEIMIVSSSSTPYFIEKEIIEILLKV